MLSQKQSYPLLSNVEIIRSIYTFKIEQVFINFNTVKDRKFLYHLLLLLMLLLLLLQILVFLTFEPVRAPVAQ